MNEADIWRTAKILIDALGEDAAVNAAIRTDLAIESRMLETARVWKRVWAAVEELQRRERKAGEALN